MAGMCNVYVQLVHVLDTYEASMSSLGRKKHKYLFFENAFFNQFQVLKKNIFKKAVMIWTEIYEKKYSEYELFQK